MRQDAWQKEWKRLLHKEERALARAQKRTLPPVSRLAEKKIPAGLQQTLEGAFAKAFAAVFRRGRGILEKTYNREKLERQFLVSKYAADLKEDRKSLRQFSTNAAMTGRKNTVLSGLEGVGLGLLGIGLPDIPLFTCALLRSMYEAALHYGLGYETTEERFFILKLIEASCCSGEEFAVQNACLDALCPEPELPEGYCEKDQIERTACALARELLYLKFIQGLPIVGMVGGAYNAVYLNRVQDVADLKYRRRMLLRRRPGGAQE